MVGGRTFSESGREPIDSMNSATIRETDLPRRFASLLAFRTTVSSIRNVNFVFMTYSITSNIRHSQVFSLLMGAGDEHASVCLSRTALIGRTSRNSAAHPNPLRRPEAGFYPVIVKFSSNIKSKIS